MKMHEKIKKIRKQKGLNLKELHRLMVNDFKEGAITYRTLQRIEAGDTDSKGSSLHQIGTALGITLSELKKDTEEENKTVDLVKKNKRLGKYIFNEKTYAELLMRQNRNFMVIELVLGPEGKTRLEQDPGVGAEKDNNLDATNSKKFEKYIYCLKGKVNCFVDKDKYMLSKGDGLSFESWRPHWFVNPTKSESRCIVFQNPRNL